MLCALIDSSLYAEAQLTVCNRVNIPPRDSAPASGGEVTTSVSTSSAMDSATSISLQDTKEVVKDVKEGNVTVIEKAPAFDAKATKKLIRKIDWHLIPFLALIYL